MAEQPPVVLNYHVLQSPDFKTAFATGTYASITPGGLINLSFYLDRHPLPDLVTRTVENNVFGPENPSSIRNGIIRELQQGIILDIQAAQGLIAGLLQLVKIHEENTKAMNA